MKSGLSAIARLSVSSLKPEPSMPVAERMLTDFMSNPFSGHRRAAHGGAIHQSRQRVVIKRRFVLHGDVVPHQQVACTPAMPVNEIRLRDMRVQFGKERIAFRARHAGE